MGQYLVVCRSVRFVLHCLRFSMRDAEFTRLGEISDSVMSCCDVCKFQCL